MCEERRIKEQKYLRSLLYSFEYDEDLFEITDNDKFLIGAVLGDKNNDLSKAMQYRMLYHKLIDLNKKIQMSLSKAIELAYLDEKHNDTYLYEPLSETAFLTDYYIENALFRVECLWDVLALFFCVYYEPMSFTLAQAWGRTRGCSINLS